MTWSENRCETSSTSAATTTAKAAALSAVRRCGRSSSASCGDRHGLEAALTRRLEDVRHRLDGLRPVAALAGAVAVVQEQDRARAAARSGSGRRSRRRPGGRCRRSRRSSRPCGSPAARPPAETNGLRKPWGARKSFDALPSTASASALLGRPELVHDRRAGPANMSSEWSSPWLASSWPSATIRRAMSGCARTWRPSTKNVARAPRIPERVEHARASTRGSGPSSKVIATIGCGRRAAADHPSEEAGVRRERRPRDGDQDEDGDRRRRPRRAGRRLLPDHRRRREPDARRAITKRVMTSRLPIQASRRRAGRRSRSRAVAATRGHA